MKHSAEYRAAGGRSWHRNKSPKLLRFTTPSIVPHVEAWKEGKRQQEDKYTSDKEWYKLGKADGMDGSSRRSDNGQYLAGYSYGEYMRKN